MKECWRCQSKHNRTHKPEWRSTQFGKIWQRKLGLLCDLCWDEYLNNGGRFRRNVKVDRISRVLSEMAHGW